MPHPGPVTILQELIRCPSVTPDAGAALDVVEGYLNGAGFSCERLVFEAPGTVPVDNLFARLGKGHPHLCFAGHVDVVPPGDEARWSAPPFAAETRDGRIFGRGAEDMKGAVAAAIAAVIDFTAANGLSEGSVSLLITGDEEGPSVNGTEPVLEWMAAHGAIPDDCLVGEPTSERSLGDAVKIGRRGGLTGTLTVTGIQGHTAYPHQAANPIPVLMKLLEAISVPLDEGTEHFLPSHLEITTIDVANPSHNIIPGRVTGRFNVRFNNLWTAASLEAWLRERLGRVDTGDGVSWSLDMWTKAAEAFLTEPGRLVDVLGEAIEAETGLKPKLSTAGGTSDARFVVRHCPVAEFGLVGRSLHQIDEHVPIEELDQLTRIYRGVMERYFAR